MFSRQLFNRQFLHFLLVGGINTVFGFAAFSALVWIGLQYPWAIAISTVAGILFNFQTIGRVVFGDAALHRLSRFVGVYMVLYLLNVLGVAALTMLHLNVYVANALVVGPIAILGYILQKRFVFTNKQI